MVVVVFDLETTGLRPEKGAEILEVAAAELSVDQDGAVQGIATDPAARFFERCRPLAGAVPPFITELTGIHWEAVENADSPAVVVGRFFDWLQERRVTTLVGHNAIGFDVRFLKAHLGAAPVAVSASVAPAPANPTILHVFDTHLFARHEDGAGPYVKGYKQTDLYRAAFDEAQPNQHTAMGDITGLARLIGKRGWAQAIQAEGHGPWMQSCSFF
jgi:hypothetical protein